MKIIKLFLLLSFGLWAEQNFVISNENNNIFYKEVSRVFVKPLYQPINSARFEDMNASDMSLEMRESIEEFLPIYLNTQSPLRKRNKDYPSIAIKRFFKVLNKYMAFLEFKHQNQEIYTILDKRLSDAHDSIQQASSILDLLYGMSYYENILYISKCNNGISRQLVRRKCDNNMRILVEKYHIPNKEYFFKVIEEERKQNVNTMLEAIREEGVSQKNLEKFSVEFTKYTQYYYMKYSQKLRDIVKDDSYESLDDYENYMNMELENMRSIKDITKTVLSNILVEGQKLLSIEDKYYGNLIDYQVKTMSVLLFTGLGETYQRYQSFLTNYNKFLKSCPQNN